MNPHDELRVLAQQIEIVPDLTALTSIYYRVEDIAGAYPHDFQLQMLVGEIKQMMTRRAGALQGSPAAPLNPPPQPPAPIATETMQPGMDPGMNMGMDPNAATQLMTPPPGMPPMAPPPPMYQDPAMMAPPPPPPMAPPPPPMMMQPPPEQMAPQMAPPPMQPPPPAMQPPPPKLPPNVPPPQSSGGSGKTGIMLGAGALLVLLLAGGGYWFWKSRTPAAPPADTPTAHVSTNPPGAAIRINDENKCTSDCDLALPPGDYQVVALLDGYEAAAGALSVKAGELANLALTLEPQSQTVRVLTDLAAGKAKLDDQPEQDLIEGQFTFEKVAAGVHTLSIASPTGQAKLNFELANGKLPQLQAGMTASNVMGVAVATFAKQAHLVSSSGPLKLTVNGKPQQDATPSGVDISEYEPGLAELVVGEGGNQKSLKESFAPAPAVTLFLKSDENIGTLIVATGGENDVRVFVNNREVRKTQRGEVRLRTIGNVTVRVTKDGMEASNPQTAEVKKGAELRMEFTLKPAANFSSLTIRGGTPGADVLLDLRQVGAIQSDGTFSNSSVMPGVHVIELRRDGFQPRRIEREFKAGTPVTLSGGEVTLASDRPAPKEVAPPPVETAKAKEPPPAPKAKEPPPPPKTYGMGDFENPDAWKEADGIFVHRGPAYLTYRPMSRGVYNFTIQLRRGGNIFRGGRVRWFVDYTNTGNYALFEMDDKNFWVKDVVNGKTSDRSKTEHKAGEKTWTVQIEVLPDKVNHRMQINGAWYNLDSWEQSGRDFSDGRFGFLVQGDNEIAVSDFKFTPSR